MIKVKIEWTDFDKNEWKDLKKKLYAEKNLVKLINYETPECKKVKEEWGDIENIIDDIFSIEDDDDFYAYLPFLEDFLSITTKSRKTLTLLNDFIKKNHYENNYRIYDVDNKIKITLDILLGDLLEKLLKK